MGLNCLEEIKGRSPHTPVIVFTGKIYRAVKEFVALLGANELLEKSCSTELFISCVKESLQGNYNIPNLSPFNIPPYFLLSNKLQYLLLCS